MLYMSDDREGEGSLDWVRAGVGTEGEGHTASLGFQNSSFTGGGIGSSDIVDLA